LLDVLEIFNNGLIEESSIPVLPLLYPNLKKLAVIEFE
jgi:hypothetical protein